MKTYLRYESETGFGVISSPRANVCLVESMQATLAVTPAFDHAICWDLMKGEIRSKFLQRKGTDGEVTSLQVFLPEKSDVGGLLAIGRHRGRIDFHDFSSVSSTEGPNQDPDVFQPKTSVLGHSSAVSTLSFSHDGTRLASGSKDTFIALWDVLSETGLFRLRGHKDEVTCVRFCTLDPSSDEQVLISSSKDNTIKIWNLEAQYCEKTIADHNSSVWGFALSLGTFESMALRNRLFTGASDGLLRSFDLSTYKMQGGSLPRQTGDRCETLAVAGEILVVQSAGRVIEFYSIRSEEKIVAKHKRRLKRLREKNKTIHAEDEALWTQDEVEIACTLRAPSKARSVAIAKVASDEYSVLISYTNNFVELYSLRLVSSQQEQAEMETSKRRKRADLGMDNSKAVLEIKTRLELQGHRSDIRSVALGNDDEMAITAADGAIKLWDVASGACLRTMPSGFALCCAFIPKTLVSVTGTREGNLIVHSLNDGSVIAEMQKCHEAVYSLDVHPDGKSMVTCGGSDRTCKFWTFSNAATNFVELAHTRTLKLGEDDAQCVRYTRGSRDTPTKLCVALLDSTVKVFFEDSLKFAFSIYGHSLPVLSMDCADDGSILATASTDKTIKIWGMDFGDCHRSVVAHEASVTCVRFVPKTHYIVTSGRDGRVRYWDADANLTRILSFEQAHYGDSWSLAVSRNGGLFLSVGKDKRIRKYVKTKDLVFLEEEQAKEMELQIELEEESKNHEFLSSVAGVPAGDGAVESMTTNKKSLESIELGDRFIEILQQIEQEGQPASEILLQQCGVDIAKTARMFPAQDVQDALTFLPFVHVVPLLTAFAYALQEREEVELVSKSALRLVRVHRHQLYQLKDRQVLEMLQSNMRQALWELRDMMGLNLAGLRWFERDLS